MEKNYEVYIVECADDSLYVGITTDLERRVEEHNSSKLGAKYTKARRPVTLVHRESFKDRSEASKREYELKHFTRSEKIALFRKKTEK